MDPSSSSSSLVPYSSSYKRKRDQAYSCYDDEPFYCSKKPKNDVFLNYSSEDIGKSFVSHLKGALKRSSFTISDHTMLPIGHDESSELLKAIQDSEIYVVVLSANYSSSVKCLDELVLIMDSLIKFKKRRVFPIFFNVDPSHIRSQQGSFLEAFHGHDSNIDPERVQKWRHALQDVGQRAGQTMQNGVDEADILLRIVKELEKMQGPQHLHVTDHHVGIGSRAEELISKLRLDCEDVLVVAVFGISGIGKTEIVKATYNRIATDFDVNCFLADIHYYCGKQNWKVELQKELISSLTQYDKPPITRHNDGLTKIRKLISRRKILLVLDDVDNFQQLEALGIDPAWFYNGSRIIVTTRDKKSLGNIPYVCYHTMLLNRRESLNLFTRLMFSRDELVDKKFVEEIVCHAGGLPLVLNVWSRHFACHERKQWPRLLEKLRRIPHEDVQKKLQVSYDSLSPRAKNLFRDIACFFDGVRKDLVIKVLQDEDNAFFPDIEIQDLIDKGLVKEDEFHRLRMHAVIREMGREVVRQENEDDPGQRSRLVGKKDVVRVLRDCSGTDSIRSIYLGWNDLDEDVTVQVEAFRKMSNLMFISLHKIDIHPQWSSPLCFKHLKYLDWDVFPFRCLDKFDMGNVVVIQLFRSKLEIIWEGVKSLKKLRILAVSYSSYLTRTGSFIGLENLEELDLRECENLEELDSSIGCLQKLVTLDLNGCTQLKRVPWEMIGKLTSLVTLDLSDCPNILNIPHELGNLKSLTYLYLEGNSLESLPDSLCQLHQLNEIVLSGCDNLKSIPSLPPNIQHVVARDCSSLVSLPDSLCQLHQLSEIQLSGGDNLKSIPDLPPNIQLVQAPDCSSLVSLPDSLCQLHQLDEIELSGCDNLKSIPNLPPNIQRVTARDCSSLASLPDSLCQLHQLDEIELSGCANLKSIPNLPLNIRLVRASHCSSLVSLPSNMHELQFLTWLVLDNCEELGSEGFLKVTGLRNLHRLSMRNCNVSQVSSEIGNLASLEYLDLSGNTFPSLHDSISNLSRLNFLGINDCHKLKLLSLLPSKLRKIDARGCGSLDVMPFDSTQMGYIFRSQWCRQLLLVNSQLEPSFTRGLIIKLSGKEEEEVVIPEWCGSYTSISGKELCFVAPITTQLYKKICGVIFYGYGCYSSITMLNKTKGTSHEFDVPGLDFPDDFCACMGLYPLNDETLVVEAGDTLLIQHGEVSRCGLSWIYEDDVVDNSVIFVRDVNGVEPPTTLSNDEVCIFHTPDNNNNNNNNNNEYIYYDNNNNEYIYNNNNNNNNNNEYIYYDNNNNNNNNEYIYYDNNNNNNNEYIYNNNNNEYIYNNNNEYIYYDNNNNNNNNNNEYIYDNNNNNNNEYIYYDNFFLQECQDQLFWDLN